MEKAKELDSKALDLMKLRIIKIERDNARDRQYSEKDMVIKIRKIIEEEIQISEG